MSLRYDGANLICAGAVTIPMSGDNTFHIGGMIARGSSTGGWWWVWDNKLLYVQRGDTNATCKPCISQYYGGAFRADWARVAQLGAPWDTQYGIATNRVASPTSGATTTMLANAIVDFAWTVATNETLELDVRRTDADNRWIVRCDQAGSTIKLIERNAGVETERGTAAATWLNTGVYQVLAICESNTIDVYTGLTAASTQYIHYTGATFNATATGVKVVGFAAGADLITWPRTLAGAALTELQKYTA